MVILRKSEKGIFISSNDRIFNFDLKEGTDSFLDIPRPVFPIDSKRGRAEALKTELRTVTTLEFSHSKEYFVISTENKQVVVFDKNFHVLKNFVIHRAASKVCFTPSNDIIVADKTGDVYLYKLSDGENEPLLLLGHLSVILDIQISECGKFIITCDRDEKIRVSQFPNCYNIASYCLGHTEFVTRLKLVKNVLISASGDGTVRFWNFLSGVQLDVINTNKYIDDKSLLKDFCDDMDKEKVEVSALPVADLQVFSGDKLYIAVSVYRYNAIQLYTTDLMNFQSCYVTKLSFQSPFEFCFDDNDNLLYVLSNKLNCFEISDRFIEKTIPLFDDLFDKHKNQFTQVETDTMSVLYKRKYDNVQEYLVRKKQRLDMIK